MMYLIAQIYAMENRDETSNPNEASKIALICLIAQMIRTKHNENLCNHKNQSKSVIR